ncbi:MAG: LapA family protein [Akkermansiaceae bacterium]
MSDPRYAPPSEKVEVPLSDLEREYLRWRRINLISEIPVHLSPIIAPIVLIYYFLTDHPPLSLITIATLLILGFWLFSNWHLSKLKFEILRQKQDSIIPPDLPTE